MPGRRMGGDVRPNDRSAAELAALVREREASAGEVARACLARIDERDGEIGAFQRVEEAAVLAEAAAVDGRSDRERLPLAGVPVAVKDNVAVEGLPTRKGSRATPTDPASRDHEIVRRLRAAGAVVLGKTRLPELGVWATTDSSFGITRNPRAPELSAGGSSGGSAAAVAAGMCPIAHGNDGLGSIRIPAAACGIFGLKPGAGVVPSGIGKSSWFGLAENGPIARAVDDAALMLSVLADRPDWRETDPPPRSLRIAVSTDAPVPGVSPDEAVEEATLRAAERLEEAGHRVGRDDPPYTLRSAAAVTARWFAGARDGAAGLDPSRLEPRTRCHARLGRIAGRLGLIRPEARERWRRRLAPFFGRYELLLTPTLATLPPPAVAWSERSWSANFRSNLRFAPYTAPWNLAGYPAASVPVGGGRSPLPVSVQLVAPPGEEARLLSVARGIEEGCPASTRPRP